MKLFNKRKNTYLGQVKCPHNLKYREPRCGHRPDEMWFVSDGGHGMFREYDGRLFISPRGGGNVDGWSQEKWTAFQKKVAKKFGLVWPKNAIHLGWTELKVKT